MALLQMLQSFIRRMSLIQRQNLLKRIIPRSLRESERQFREVVDNFPDLIVRFDRDLRIRYANNSAFQFIGLPSTEVLGAFLEDAWEGGFANCAEETKGKLLRAFDEGLSNTSEVTWDKGKNLSILEVRCIPEKSKGGQIGSVLCIGRDITLLRKSEQRLLDTEEMGRLGHWEMNYRNRRIFISDELRRIMGESKDWNPDFKNILNVISKEDRKKVGKIAGESFLRRLSFFSCSYKVVSSQGQLCYHHTQVRVQYDENGRPMNLNGITQDITKLKKYESALHNITFQDRLTGLSNRDFFNIKISSIISESFRSEALAGLLLIDIDHFTKINETFGHQYGDSVLAGVGKRLQELLCGKDFIARLGGDEFAIILSNCGTAYAIEHVAEKVINAFKKPLRIDDQERFISVSIGIAVCPDDASTGDELLQYADTALTYVKKGGRDDFKFYASELTAKAREQMILESALHQAVLRQEFRLLYQPKVELKEKRFIGAEALLRWNHPDWGWVSPDRFIEIAEETRMILDIGAWVLETAFNQAARWNYLSSEPIQLSVNLSSYQFQVDDPAENIISIARRTGCRPEWIELEITESLLLGDSHSVLYSLKKLEKSGFSLAIDDFGTGYSALSYLNRFPIHTLKIDKSFITGLNDNPRNIELVKAILSMSQALGIKVVAEGIEQKQEADFLSELGCDIGQGYYYGRPMEEGWLLYRITNPHEILIS